MNQNIHMSVALSTVAQGIAHSDIRAIVDAIIDVALVSDVVDPALAIIEGTCGMSRDVALEIITGIARGYISHQLDPEYVGLYQENATSAHLWLVNHGYYDSVMDTISMTLAGMQGAYLDFIIANHQMSLLDALLKRLQDEFDEIGLFLRGFFEDDVRDLFLAYRYAWEGSCPPPPSVVRAWQIASELAHLADNVSITTEFDVSLLQSAVCAFRATLYRRRPPILAGLAYKRDDLNECCAFVADHGDRDTLDLAQKLRDDFHDEFDNLDDPGNMKLHKAVVFYYMMVNLT